MFLLHKSFEISKSYEELSAKIKKMPKGHISGNRISVVMCIPHSGFGLFRPQIIRGTMEEGATGVLMYVHVRPLVPELIVIMSLCALCLLITFLMCLGEGSLLFCVLLNAFTMLYVAFTLWQMAECLKKFINLIKEV